MKIVYGMILIVVCLPALAGVDAKSEGKPNIVLVLMDNFGWGELGVYGGGVLRGAPTPRIDQLAAEGLRLANFNVETVCTTSRAALMTGRYAVRSGAMYPMYSGSGIQGAGLTQWEVTIPEMLAEQGYISGIFGKWHLGDTEGRFPTDQGFHEWYGIPNTSDESTWQDDTHPDQAAHPMAFGSYIMEGRNGEVPKKVKLFNNKNRKLVDKEITDRAIDFIERQVNANNPFFVYIPYTLTHSPVLPHPEFKGKTGNGDQADVLAQIDHYVGRLLDTVDDLSIRENTIFIFTSDNGHPNASGPWSAGSDGFLSPEEGLLRVPFILRWPEHVPKGNFSNEIVHQMDLFPTLANIVGAEIPGDRIIDGIDQVDFFTGKQGRSNRQGFVIYAEDKVLGVKWRNWKMLTGTRIPSTYNLITDQKEKNPIWSWVRFPAGKFLQNHLQSFVDHPAIPAGTPDPYIPN